MRLIDKLERWEKLLAEMTLFRDGYQKHLKYDQLLDLREALRQAVEQLKEHAANSAN